MWKFSEIRMIFWGTSTIDEETYLCYAELLVKEDKFKIYLSHQDLDEIKTILGKKILFANIDNIYIPISFLNKGSSCEVNT